VTFAPQLPADWDRVAVRNVAAGLSRVEFAVERGEGRLTITATSAGGGGGAPAIALRPALPLDARVRAVSMDGQDAPVRTETDGDVQRVEVILAPGSSLTRRVVVTYDGGTEVFSRIELPDPGAASQGLRIVRSRAEGGTLRLVVEGLAGREYRLGVRTPHRVEAVPGVAVTASPLGADLVVSFEGPAEPERYVRRTIDLPLR
jgi:hypothetical protein